MESYTYEFATENKEIEISEEWMAVLSELDRKEYNKDQKETRRHTGFGAYKDEAGWLSTFTPRKLIRIAGQTISPDDKRFAKAIKRLTKKQRNLYRMVYCEGLNLKEFAELSGISPSAATQIHNGVKKVFSEIFVKP